MGGHSGFTPELGAEAARKLQSEVGAATLCTQRDQLDQAEGGRPLAVSALAPDLLQARTMAPMDRPSGTRRADLERRLLGIGQGSHRDRRDSAWNSEENEVILRMNGETVGGGIRHEQACGVVGLARYMHRAMARSVRRR